MKICIEKSNWEKSSREVFENLDGGARLYLDLMFLIESLCADLSIEYRVEVEIVENGVFITPQENTVTLPQVNEAAEIAALHSREELKEQWKKVLASENRYHIDTFEIARGIKRLSANVESHHGNYRLKINY